MKLKSKISKVIPKNIRDSLVKLVTLYSISYNKFFLQYHLSLKNFWYPIKSVEVTFIGNDKFLSVPYRLSNKKLEIWVPIDFLSIMKTSATIKLKINDEPIIVTPADSFANEDGVKIVENKCIRTNVEKSISISNQFNINSHTIKNYEMCDIKVKYNYISFRINNVSPESEFSNLKIRAISHKKTKIFNLKADENGKYIIDDFSLFTAGKWRLFFNINEESFSIKMNKDKNKNKTFNTFNHSVTMLSDDNEDTILNFTPHIINMENIYISKYKKLLTILIQSENLRSDKNYSLIMNDSKGRKDFNYTLINTPDGHEIQLNLSDCLQTFYNKRFFVVLNEDQPIKYQMDTRNINLNKYTFQELIDNQLVTFKFYKRLDYSLGLTYKSPAIQKYITNIDEFKIQGYVNNMNNDFVDYKIFLYLEERETKEALKFPLNNKFEVYFSEEQLINLKSKNKTIIDFFFLLTNSDGEIIRKEKIRYKHADYKKDNYYDYFSCLDNHNNEHHFLYTTTPVGNLKIETFTIPNYIKTPYDSSQKDSDIWLIGERSNTAQDNGIALFRWLKKNTNVKVYYVIDATADDYKKIENEKNIIKFGSQEHYEIAFKAKTLLCTHDLENILPYKPARGFFHYENTYKVFLQHGVLGRKNVEYHKKYYDTPFDLFIVSSETEKREIVMEEMGYSENEVVTTGLARFDYLIQSEKPKNILLMPTWRDWINTDDNFLKSEYNKRYKSLLKNKKLLDLLDKHNYILNFYPHYRAQEYFQRELKIDNHKNRINFIELGSNTVQRLLIDHALLITDYSSVSFDFFLMNKPVIYYHFDSTRFFKKGILRPIDETFIGEIATFEDELVQQIENRIKDNMNKNFDDVSGVIKHQDRNNRKRIYEEIIARQRVKNK